MIREQIKLNKLLNRVRLSDLPRILFSKTSVEAKEFSLFVLRQVYYTFNQALFPLCILAILIAVTVSVQAGLGLSVIGASSRIGELWVWMVFRVFGPLLSALLIIARSCTAVTTETAVMKYDKEIEALELMGIPAVDFVFAPRIIAGAISGFCMAFSFVVIAFFWTWLAKNWFASMTLEYLFESVSRAITLDDIIHFVLKTTMVGAGIFWMSCKIGLSLKKASNEIPGLAMHAVIDCSFWTFIIHGLFIILYIMSHGFHLL